ncbi:hypothetical protein [Oleiagrimonas sp. MCCC 1A03011]|uniref:hypothetical protein n=1 Tax=Oleiagrimonas sp. MCCC 1A03011 TaxID=1926883 RepID=UPI0011BF3DCF|nr:hypothetical protein [Oleiagrimonas sp. MCCC 1A03011]
MKRRVGFGAFPRALAAALQWKLLLLWFLFTLIPASIVARPLHGLLSTLLDHSVHAGEWARSFHGLAMTDVLVQVGRQGLPALSAAAVLGMLLTLLLAPFLVGMSVTAVRGPHRPGFGELMHGGLSEYWRLFRFMLWALALYGIAFMLGRLAAMWASHQADQAILESQADFAAMVARTVLIVLLVIAQSMVEAGRGRIVADPAQRSATRAFFSGIALVFKRPLVTLGLYLAVTVTGFAITFLLGLWRMHQVAVGPVGFSLALLVTLLMIVSMAWMRTARVAAMGAVAKATLKPGSNTVAPA